jgi:hypothetical protein
VSAENCQWEMARRQRAEIGSIPTQREWQKLRSQIKPRWEGARGRWPAKESRQRLSNFFVLHVGARHSIRRHRYDVNVSVKIAGVWGISCLRTGSKTLERRPSRAATVGVLFVIFCQIGCVQKAFIPATKCYIFPMTVRRWANCVRPGRALLLYDHYLLAHNVHVDPFQHGGHEQNEGEEPENGECVGVKAFFIGHMIGG